MIREIADFRHGGETIPLVTVVPPREAPAFFGVCGPELRRRLRELRDQGKLVANQQRLTKRVRVSDPTCKYGIRHVRCYVLLGPRREFEKARGRAKVMFWG